MACFFAATHQPSAPSLQTWEAAAANAKNTRANVLVVGDSISEGAWSELYFDGWVHVLNKYLQVAFGGAAGGEGFVPAIRGFNGQGNGATLEAMGDRWWRTGSPTVNRAETNIGGLGRRSINLAVGQTVYRSFYGDRVALMFTGWAGGADAKITIDSTDYTFTTAAAETTSGRMWTSPPLTRGNHKVTVTTAGPGQVTFDGGTFWDGDYTKGATLWDGSHSGYRTDHFDGHDTASARWAGGLEHVNPHLVIIALGTNDEHQPESETYTPEIYGQRLGAIVDLVRAKSTTNPSIAFLLQPTPGAGGGEEWWMRHRAAAIATAEAKGVALLDIKGIVPSGPATGSSALYFNANHPNSAGMRAYVEAIAPMLGVNGNLTHPPATAWHEPAITVTNTSASAYDGPDISCTVIVPPSGRVLVALTGRLNNSTTNIYLAFSADGANTIPASGTKAIRETATANASTCTAQFLVEGLTPGVTRFRAKPFVTSGTGTASCVGIIADPRP